MFLLRSDYAGAPIPDEENLLRDPAFLKAIEDAREGRLDDQLELIEGILSERNWREEYLSVLKYEAALTLGILDTYLKGSMPPQRYQDGRSHLLSEWLAVGGPQGWDDRRRAFTIEFFVDLIPLVDSGAGLAKYRTQFHQRFEGSTLSPIYYWHYLLEMELHAARASSK